jgi:hypothetical protein
MDDQQFDNGITDEFEEDGLDREEPRPDAFYLTLKKALDVLRQEPPAAAA